MSRQDIVLCTCQSRARVIRENIVRRQFVHPSGAAGHKSQQLYNMFLWICCFPNGKYDVEGRQESIHSANSVNVSSRELGEAAKLLMEMRVGHIWEGVNLTQVSP